MRSEHGTIEHGIVVVACQVGVCLAIVVEIRCSAFAQFQIEVVNENEWRDCSWRQCLSIEYPKRALFGNDISSHLIGEFLSP